MNSSVARFCKENNLETTIRNSWWLAFVFQLLLALCVVAFVALLLTVQGKLQDHEEGLDRTQQQFDHSGMSEPHKAVVRATFGDEQVLLLGMRQLINAMVIALGLMFFFLVLGAFLWRRAALILRERDALILEVEGRGGSELG